MRQPIRGCRAALIVAAMVGVQLLSAAPAAIDAPAGAPLAWIRFVDGPERYADVPYRWLGEGDLTIKFEVKPEAGQVIQLLWGAKADTRMALASINGKPIELKRGGYDGFAWLSVPIPAGIGGDACELVLRRVGDRYAFIAEARLADPRRDAESVPAAELAKRSHRASFALAPAPARATGPVRRDSFPEMQALWKTDPPPPAQPAEDPAIEAAFRQAEKNARRAHEQFFRCRAFVHGWLAHADPKTGLIPRNLTQSRDVWNACDAAADNYPYMVLSCALADRPLFEGRMREMLENETRLTSRIDRLPDTWSFSRQAFADEKPDLDRIIFGAAEYVKDGLVPLTEWLGKSPWSDRMIGIVDDIAKHAAVPTPFGPIPSTNVEVNGDLLQAFSRVFWLTGDRKYLEWAMRLGDYYVLGENHPTRNFTSLRLRDHGCEIVAGLCELYVACHFKAQEKKVRYHEPIHAMCDRILEVGRTPIGMLYDSINPKTGEHSKGFCDTWGYNYNGIYSVYLVDGNQEYREAVRFVLSNLRDNLTEYHWGSADEYADSIEGAINLCNREPIPSAAEWIDSEIDDMWSVQQPDGVLEGWHGDGNSARTGIMYALWKTQGLTVQPWSVDIRFGAVRDGDRLYVSLRADKPWSGKLVFDEPRSRTAFHFPLDYPRINQFPQWFCVAAGQEYVVRDAGASSEKFWTGEELRSGLPVEVSPGRELRLIVGRRRM